MEMKTLNDMFDMPEPDIKANIPIDQQIALWTTGVSVHNHVTGQHCPDFSCCIPSLASPIKDRIRFKNAVVDGRLLLMAGLMKQFMTALHEYYGINVVFMDISQAYDFVLN